MRLKLFAFLVWLTLAGSAAYWLLKWSSPPEVPAYSAVAKNASTPNLDLNRMSQLLGALPAGTVQQAPAVYASRLVLQGVVATAGGGGVALISVDNAAAKPFRVGVEVVDGVRLQGVAKTSALVGAERIYLVGTKSPAPAVAVVNPNAPSANPPTVISPTLAPSGSAVSAPSPSTGNNANAPSANTQPSLGTSVDPSMLPPEIAKAIADANKGSNSLPPVSPGAGNQTKFEYPNLVKP